MRCRKWIPSVRGRHSCGCRRPTRVQFYSPCISAGYLHVQCSSSVVSRTVCGMSLFPHAEGFVFPILECLWGHHLLCYLSMQVCIQHVWWFAYYLCVGCVCWRGVREGHHCVRIIMEIPNPDLPALLYPPLLFIWTILLFFHRLSFTSIPSCEDLKLFFPPTVCSWNMSSLLHSTSDTHREYHHHISKRNKGTCWCY